MPYDSNHELPSAVRRLPRHAQDIFREAFNHAFASYAQNPEREAIAFRVAWAAVKRVYVRSGGQWQLRAASAARRPMSGSRRL